MKRARPALDATSIRAMQSIYEAAMPWLSVAVVDSERSPGHSPGDPTWSPRPVTQQPTV
jgi:hypothetical protein